MRSLLWVSWIAAAAACTHAAPVKCPESTAAAVVPSDSPPAPPPRAPELDDHGVISQSQAFLAAIDKADVATFQSMLGVSFVNFQRARFYDAAYFSKALKGRIDRKLPPRSRTCKDERVFRGPNVAIYVGACVEQIPAHADSPSTIYEGWETIAWVPEGGVWKVAHWQGQKGGIEAEREDWNEAYRKSTSFKTTANQHLIDSVRGRKPGLALDVAMGQGRNALYLASQKWRVTGVDISDEGIRMAKEAAAKAKLKLQTVQADNNKYDFGTARWDLVTLIYAGDDPKLVERIKPSIRKGGLFVVEYFHEDATQGTGIGGFATGELAALFADGWKIVKDEVVEDVADWTLRKTKLVRFLAEKQ
ncbi:MAG: class I SAM-dependent methyltransferase [Deltaproteobacteria bacterium]|nr:class I SAM-dependent methyltransferase [Deltaproteobacteria bacterium]MDQ3295123.1 class I SAM-dependent methyltransferase [Myxococcota bacterium]